MSRQESKKKIDLSAKKIVAGWPKVGYDGENERVLDFYYRKGGTTKRRNSMFFGKKLADVFIFAMTLGKKAGIRKSYAKKSDRRESIDMEYFATQPEYLWMMLAVAIEESNGDLDIFKNPREGIIDVCEEYANYGVDLLIDLEESGNVSDKFYAYEEKLTELLDNIDSE